MKLLTSFASFTFFLLLFTLPATAATITFAPNGGNIPLNTDTTITAYLSTGSQTVTGYQLVSATLNTTSIKILGQKVTSLNPAFNCNGFNKIENLTATTTRISVICTLANISSPYSNVLAQPIFEFAVRPQTSGNIQLLFSGNNKVTAYPGGENVLTSVSSPTYSAIDTSPTPSQSPSPTPSRTPTPTVTTAPTNYSSATLVIKLKHLPYQNLPQSVTADLKFTQSGANSYEFATKTFSLTPSTGEYSYTTPQIIQPNPLLPYTLTITPKGFLDQQLQGITLAAGTNTINLPNQFLSGDINCDNQINLQDISQILGIFIDLESPVTSQTIKYDLNYDGKITINDITLMLSSYTSLNVQGSSGPQTTCN